MVDNGSTDGGDEYIAANYPWIRLVKCEENLGFGAANNIALRIALKEGYDYVYLLNQDAWLEKDTLGLLLAAGSDYALLSPVQRASDGSLDRNFARKCGKYLQADVSEVPFVMAAHWLIKSDVLRCVGGFSPAFKLYGEDDNWIDRLHYRGLKCAVISSASAVHDRASREESKDRRMRLKCVASVVRVSNPSYCFALMAVLEPCRLVATAIKNCSLVPLRFILDLIKRYPELMSYRRASLKGGAFLD